MISDTESGHALTERTIPVILPEADLAGVALVVVRARLARFEEEICTDRGVIDGLGAVTELPASVSSRIGTDVCGWRTSTGLAVRTSSRGDGTNRAIPAAAIW